MEVPAQDSIPLLYVTHRPGTFDMHPQLWLAETAAETRAPVLIQDVIQISVVLKELVQTAGLPEILATSHQPRIPSRRAVPVTAA